MGLLDSIEGMAGQAMAAAGNTNGQVAGGFIQALQEHPGGLGAVMDGFRNNGMDQHVNNWSNGQTQPATPEQVQTGLGGTGLIESTAEKAGVSPEIAKIALATILPMAIAHFAPGGQAPPQGGGLESMGGGLLSKFL